MPHDHTTSFQPVFYAQDESKSKVKVTFKALGYVGDMEHNLKLREFSQKFKVIHFRDRLFAYTVGRCIVIFNTDVALEDVSLVPRALSEFFCNGSLGIVVFPDINLAIVRKGPHAIADFELGASMDIHGMQIALHSSGWKLIF